MAKALGKAAKEVQKVKGFLREQSKMIKKLPSYTREKDVRGAYKHRDVLRGELKQARAEMGDARRKLLKPTLASRLSGKPKVAGGTPGQKTHTGPRLKAAGIKSTREDKTGSLANFKIGKKGGRYRLTASGKKDYLGKGK